jgi:hypothetical protein
METNGVRPVDHHVDQQGRRATAPPAAIGPLTPRLLDLDSAGSYCGVKRWTIQEWLRAGLLRRVPMPARVLRVDREDLDRLIAMWKGGEQ